MIAHFKKLFDYDRHANNLMIDTMLSSGIITGKPVELIAHTLAAKHRWLTRCKYQPTPASALWPDLVITELKAVNDQIHTDWINYLNTLQDSDVDQNISYKNMSGESCNNTLEDILTHIINHGTHHRAQAGQQLKFAGAEQLPVSDYIFYIRGLK